MLALIKSIAVACVAALLVRLVILVVTVPRLAPNVFNADACVAALPVSVLILPVNVPTVVVNVATFMLSVPIFAYNPFTSWIAVV